MPRRRGRRRGSFMKKLLVIALATLFLSGCALSKAWKWFDEMEWERDDQTVKIIELFIR